MKTIEVSDEVYNELKLHYEIMNGIIHGDQERDFELSDYVSILLGVGTNVFLSESNYASFIAHYCVEKKFTEERKVLVMQTLNEYLVSLKQAGQSVK